jgi:hypothetical protein
MLTEYDPQIEAEAALRLAVEAGGTERQRLIRLALAWQEIALARRRGRRVALPDSKMRPADLDAGAHRPRRNAASSAKRN